MLPENIFPRTRNLTISLIMFNNIVSISSLEEIMGKKSVSFFALSVVFLSITLVWFSKSEISLAKYLIFVLSGFAAGAFFRSGVITLKK